MYGRRREYAPSRPPGLPWPGRRRNDGVAASPCLATHTAQRTRPAHPASDAATIGAGAQAYAAELDRPDRGVVRIIAVPAEHGPADFADENGPVTGFILQADELPAVYVSGDNASVHVVRSIAEQFGRIEVAVLFTGAARVATKAGGAPLTLTAGRAAAAARSLDARSVVPVHHHGWGHYSENADDLRRAFAAAGMEDRLLILEPGETVAA
jgi:L-ascorbate metabolism protein UlaG (beta-lactamase superfamily)